MTLPEAGQESPQPEKTSDPAAPAAVLVDGRVVSHTYSDRPRVEVHAGTCDCAACRAAQPPDRAADYL